MRYSITTRKIRSQHNLTTTTLFMFFISFNMLLSQETMSYTYTTSEPQTLDVYDIHKRIGPNQKKYGLRLKSHKHLSTITAEIHANNSEITKYVCSEDEEHMGFIPILDDDPQFIGTNLQSLVKNLPVPIPANMLLYKTTLTGFTSNSSPTYVDGGFSLKSETVYFTSFVEPCSDLQKPLSFSRTARTNDYPFINSNVYTWNLALNYTGKRFNSLYQNHVPVTVTLTFTGDYTLDDINEIILPGLTLSPEDFDREIYFDADEYYWGQDENSPVFTMALEDHELEIRGNQTPPASGDTGIEEIIMDVWGKFVIHNSDGTSPTINEAFKYNVWVEEGLVTDAFIIQPTANWADYVFNDTYKLPSLKELKTYIDTYKHLPNIPSLKDLENNGGYTQHNLNVKLLEKIEQLTLYKIQQAKKISNLKLNIEKNCEALKAYNNK